MISHPERSCNIEVDFLAKILFSLVSSRALDDCRSPLLQTDSFSPLPLSLNCGPYQAINARNAGYV